MKNPVSFIPVLPIALIGLLTAGCADPAKDYAGIAIADPGPRVETRDDCKVLFCTETINDCCCSVSMQDPMGIAITLRLCNVAGTQFNCTGSATGSCPGFSSVGKFISLSPSDPVGYFCANHDSVIWIYNGGIADAAVLITCQYGQFNPQVIQVTIMPDQYLYYNINDSCFMTLC